MLFILDDLPRESNCWGLLQESKLLLLHNGTGLAVSQPLHLLGSVPPEEPGAPGLVSLNIHYKGFTLQLWSSVSYPQSYPQWQREVHLHLLCPV